MFNFLFSLEFRNHTDFALKVSSTYGAYGNLKSFINPFPSLLPAPNLLTPKEKTIIKETHYDFCISVIIYRWHFNNIFHGKFMKIFCYH